MILGTFPIFPSVNVTSVFEEIRRTSFSEGLVFHQEDHEDFRGGFFLNSLLPYSILDYYYFDDKSDLVILLSGSIFNREELLSYLKIASLVPDPELIAGLFLKEGPDFVKNLNGDFAIFIGQPAKRQAYLFRDHIGIRPLAYVSDSQALSFSTDITGLCRAFSDGQAVDSDYLLGYFKYIDYRKTPNALVKKLLPGHFLHFSEEGIDITKYWEPEKIRIDRKLQYYQMLSDLKALLYDSVRIRCDNRFTAGAHVSSGLDSGIISTLARKEYNQQDDFYGFSWSPGDFTPGSVKFDEREIVRKSCEKTNIKPVFSDMTEKDFQRFVSDFYSNQGYFEEDNVVKQAVEYKTNLVFSGWGGDEFISTGDRGIEIDLLLHLKWGTFFHRNKVSRPKQLVKTMFYYVLYPALGILDKGTAQSFRNEGRYIKKTFKKSERKALRNFYFHTSRHQLHLRMLRFYHLQERCESWAINGFRKGVEYRYPLLDKRIIEYMLKVPSELLCKTEYFRPLLREIGEGILPDEVRWQFLKSDPVWREYIAELFKVSAGLFLEEVDLWKTNSDLYFVDFDLLTHDITKYKEHSPEIDFKTLFRGLVYIKAIYEFTVKYRKKDVGEKK